MIGKEILKLLEQTLTDNSYMVAVCESGMMEEDGMLGLREEGRAYEIEQTYGKSPEKLFHVSCFSRRPEIFYDFYKKEILEKVPSMTSSVGATAKMERQDRLRYVVTTDTLDPPKAAGVEDVIYLHGEIYDNMCTHYGEKYSMEYMKNLKHIPLCEDCRHIIHPGTSLYREMVDSGLMSRAVGEVSKAEMLLVLGTSLRSEVYSHYIRYFQGKKMTIIHRVPRPLDEKVDMMIYDLPQNILPLLVEER